MTISQPKPANGFRTGQAGSFNSQIGRRIVSGEGPGAGRPGRRRPARETNCGCVENEAELCAELFRRRQVQGIVVGAVNFGDEQSAATVVRQAQLDVPVLIFGLPGGRPVAPRAACAATPSAACC